MIVLPSNDDDGNNVKAQFQCGNSGPLAICACLTIRKLNATQRELSGCLCLTSFHRKRYFHLLLYSRCPLRDGYTSALFVVLFFSTDPSRVVFRLLTGTPVVSSDSATSYVGAGRKSASSEFPGRPDVAARGRAHADHSSAFEHSPLSLPEGSAAHVFIRSARRCQRRGHTPRTLTVRNCRRRLFSDVP